MEIESRHFVDPLDALKKCFANTQTSLLSM